MRLGNILKGLECKLDNKTSRIDICGVTDDSRKVAKGGLFVAVRGYSQDGAGFIEGAIKKGVRVIVSEADFDSPKGVVKVAVSDARSAMSVIADNYYGRASRKLKMVGVTGTNGKTTITYILEGIIKAAGRQVGVIGTINYRLNNMVKPAKNTTPGSGELQSILSEMVKASAGYALMEVSSHSLDQGRVDRVLFDVGIFTNITSDHLDYHKTVDNYYKAKKRLFDKLKRFGTAVLNKDDKKVAALSRSLKCKVITYGINSDADVRAENVKLSADGTHFTVRTPDRSFEINTKLVGIYNVSNILASVAAAIALKIPVSSIVRGVESVSFVPGRLETIDEGQPFKVFVDFAHTEDALLNVLGLLRGVVRGRIITVFGCGGDRDRSKRPLMGKAACGYSDHVIITSDNPRSEDPQAIMEEIERGIKGKFSNYEIAVDRRKAIERAISSASSGDIVVLAGKGHENYQIIKECIMPFDDRKVARSILKEKCGFRRKLISRQNGRQGLVV